MTISSSNIFPFAWGNMFGHGLNSFHMTASATGRTSRGSSSGISRGRTSARKLLGPQELSIGGQELNESLQDYIHRFSQ